MRGEPHPLRTDRLGDVGDPGQDVAADPTHGRGDADVAQPVLLLSDTDVVARRLRGRRWRPVGERGVEVGGLQHLTELLRTPLGEQELQACLGALPAVAVVAEDPHDPVPHLGRALGRHEGAEPLGEPGRRRQPPADPQVVAGAELGVDHPDERDVVDLVDDVEARVPGDRRLELPGEVGDLRVADEAFGDLPDRRRRVDDLVGRDASERGTEDHSGGVTAGLGGLQPDGLQSAPDLRDILDADPVQLDVLPVGDVGAAAPELGADRCDVRSWSVVRAPPSIRMRSMK